MTQKQQVLEYLQTGSSITPIEALNKYGSFRLSDIIFCLKKETGLNIENVQTETEYPGGTNFSGMQKEKTKYAEYIIVRDVTEELSLVI